MRDAGDFHRWPGRIAGRIDNQKISLRLAGNGSVDVGIRLDRQRREDLMLLPQPLPARRRLLDLIEIGQCRGEPTAGGHGGESTGEGRFPNAPFAANERDYDCHYAPVVV